MNGVFHKNLYFTLNVETYAQQGDRIIKNPASIASIESNQIRTQHNTTQHNLHIKELQKRFFETYITMPPYCPAAQTESTNGTSSMCKKQVHEFDGKEHENCFNNTSSVARSVPMSSCDIADGLSSQSVAQDYREVCEPLEFPQTMVCPCVTASTLDYLDACTGHANDRISCEFEVYDRKLEHIVSLDLRKNMKQVVVCHSSDRCKEGYSSHVFILGRVLQKAIYGQVRYARMLSRCGAKVQALF